MRDVDRGIMATSHRELTEKCYIGSVKEPVPVIDLAKIHGSVDIFAPSRTKEDISNRTFQLDKVSKGKSSLQHEQCQVEIPIEDPNDVIHQDRSCCKKPNCTNCWTNISLCCHGCYSQIIHYLKLLFSYVYLIATIYTIPFLIYWFALDFDDIPIPYWISVGSILLTNFTIIFETGLSFYVKLFQKNYDVRKIPDGTKYPEHVLCIFAAYLPNEIYTLEGPIWAMTHMVIPKGVKLSVLVVHNGGKQKHLNRIIRLIRKMRRGLPKGVSLDHLNVVYSRSKAQNINAAVDYIHSPQSYYDTIPEVIGIFDADHRPHPENLQRALQTMAVTNADVVQGRNCITNGSCFLAIEFDTMYCVYHPGGYLMRGFGIFGGSNGYWRTEVLDRIRMNSNMLTEDIDSAMRALRRQYKVVYNRNIISDEEAPPSFCALVKQRLRWSQGWSQVTLCHALPLIFGTGFGCCFRSNDAIVERRQEQYLTGQVWNIIAFYFRSLRSRIGILFLLIWREAYYYLATQALPAGIVALIKCTGDDCVEEGLIVMTIVLFIFPILNSIIAYFITGKHRHPEMKIRHYVIYALLSMPYELFKFHLSVLGHARNIVGLTKWQVTARSKILDTVVRDEVTDFRHEEISYDLEVDQGRDWLGEASMIPYSYQIHEFDRNKDVNSSTKPDNSQGNMKEAVTNDVQRCQESTESSNSDISNDLTFNEEYKADQNNDDLELEIVTNN